MTEGIVLSGLFIVKQNEVESCRRKGIRFFLATGRQRPWNAKVQKGKAAPNPQKHLYMLWANTPVGLGQVGCIYSAQGFEFDSVGVIWGRDLVWRTDRWVAQPKESRDTPVRNSGDEMVNLVRNAYRVLLTRGIRETRVLCLPASIIAILILPWLCNPPPPNPLKKIR